MAVGIVSTICQGLLAGRLARRFGEARVLAVGCLIFGAGLVGQVLVGRLLPHGDALVPVVMAFGAFGMAMTMPNISALISRSVDPDRQGAMLGLNMAASSSARIFGPMAAGAALLGTGPRLALPDRRGPDHPGGGHGDQRRAGLSRGQFERRAQSHLRLQPSWG